MMQLISKTQYQTFESGEFIQAAERSYDETIRLIKEFPWESQREHLKVSLTCPSITIDHSNGTYLKLALYYNGKFALHFLNRSDELFTKSFTNLNDTYPFIRSFFDETEFPAETFKKETTWFQKNRIHFATQDFVYQVTPQSIRQYIWSTSSTNFILTAFISFFLIYKSPGLPAVIWSLLVIFVMGGGINLLLIWNYYSYAKDKTLIMSRGNDIFYYGEKKAPDQYSKKDIDLVTLVWLRSSTARGNIFDEFSFIKISMKDGRTLIIPNLIIDHFAMEYKLYECRKTEKKAFPLIKESSFS